MCVCVVVTSDLIQNKGKLSVSSSVSEKTNCFFIYSPLHALLPPSSLPSSSLHYMAKSMWIPEHTLLVSVSPPDVEPAAGICSSSHIRASVRSNTDVGDQVWFTVCIPVHPKGVGWGWGQGSVQSSSRFCFSFHCSPFTFGTGTKFVLFSGGHNKCKFKEFLAVRSTQNSVNKNSNSEEAAVRGLKPKVWPQDFLDTTWSQTMQGNI